MQSSFSSLAAILLPVALIEIVFRLWWYYYVTVTIPFIESDRRLSLILNVAFFTSGLLSWLYRTSVFLFTCILFRLMCFLQILRLKGYIKLLGMTPNVSVILSEHMRIRTQLTTISHRFRAFLVASLFTISFSQVWSLFVLLSTYEKFNFFRAGDLVVSHICRLTHICELLIYSFENHDFFSYVLVANSNHGEFAGMLGGAGNRVNALPTWSFNDHSQGTTDHWHCKPMACPSNL